MLVLTRRNGEQIQIGESIVVSVVRVEGNRVRIGIEAPREVPVRRAELEFRLPEKAPRYVSPAIGSP